MTLSLGNIFWSPAAGQSGGQREGGEGEESLENIPPPPSLPPLYSPSLASAHIPQEGLELELQHTL